MEPQAGHHDPQARQSGPGLLRDTPGSAVDRSSGRRLVPRHSASETEGRSPGCRRATANMRPCHEAIQPSGRPPPGGQSAARRPSSAVPLVRPPRRLRTPRQPGNGPRDRTHRGGGRSSGLGPGQTEPSDEAARRAVALLRLEQRGTTPPATGRSGYQLRAAVNELRREGTSGHRGRGRVMTALVVRCVAPRSGMWWGRVLRWLWQPTSGVGPSTVSRPELGGCRLRGGDGTTTAGWPPGLG
jgi:hypothetical protein